MQIRAILGLGNPGKEFDATYHNAGWMFLDFLASQSEKIAESHRPDFDYAQIKFEGRELALVKLNGVFMNESGRGLRKAMKDKLIRNLDTQLGEILIVHDDSDIAFGKYKYSFGRSSAGHRGVQDIIDTMKTKKIHRIRIGIRKKPGKALDFVLKKIPKADRATLEKVFGEIAKFISQNIK